ncbi:MAG: hypothetical protein B6242_05590 [Anaerolineaceae bacterium 4572_78]|nr:MAG: hypothetical protein B6242_05590 [Anaerolineaceae bacterium 4572_78]
MAVLEEAKIVVEHDQCKGCTLCIIACPKDVIIQLSSFNTKGYHPVEYKGEGCTGCGICFYACPEPGAIIVYKKGAVVE